MGAKLQACVAVALLVSALAPASASAADPPMSDEAREKARAGVALLEDPEGARYDEALLAFREAYKLSSNPNLLANIALCALKLERDGEAIEAYTEYLAKGTGILPAERAQVNNDLRTRKATLATLVLEFEPAAIQIVDERTNPVDGKVIRNRYDAQGGKLSLGLRSGPHKLTVSAPGHVDKTLSLTLGASSSTTERVVLAPEAPKSEPAKLEAPKTESATSEARRPEPAKSPAAPPVSAPSRDGGSVPTSVWIGAGVTAALGLGAGVTGGLALANKSSFDDANDGSDTAEADDLRSSGVTLNLTTDVLLGATAASAIVTAVLYFTSGEEVPAFTTLARLRVVPATDAQTFAGLALSGAF